MYAVKYQGNAHVPVVAQNNVEAFMKVTTCPPFCSSHHHSSPHLFQRSSTIHPPFIHHSYTIHPPFIHHSSTSNYNTIQYKNEYYYSGINPIEFRGHSNSPSIHHSLYRELWSMDWTVLWSSRAQTSMTRTSPTSTTSSCVSTTSPDWSVTQSS